MKNLPPRGFTLTEILVAISIVLVTFGLIASSASQIRLKSRDSQRLADLRALQAAIQQFYADRNHYPNAFASNMSGTLTDCTNEPASPVCTASRTYLDLIPRDPSGGYYIYSAAQDRTTNYATKCTNSANSGTCHYYILCADLEGNSTQTTENDQCEALNANYNYQVNP